MLSSRLVFRFITLVVPSALAVVSPSQLYQMVDDLVDFYMNESCLVVISNGGYITGSNVPVVYVDPFNQDIEDHNMTSRYKMAIIAPVLELGCSGIIVQVENPGEQLRLVKKTFVHVLQRTHRRFIILPPITRIGMVSINENAHVLDSENFDFRSILVEDSLRHIPDVIFAVPNDKNNLVDLWTHRFAGPDDFPRQEILLDTYNVAEKKFALGANLFPDKVNDLEGKVLKVAMFNYPPYSVTALDNGPKNGNHRTRVDGSEWRFVVEFAKLHNCSLEEVIDKDGAWGQIDPSNHTGDGVIGNVYKEEADIGISAVLAWHFASLYLDLTTAPSFRSGVTCLVPAPLQIPQWKSPILPFTRTLWATFIGMTIVSAIFTGIVNRAETHIRSEESFRMSASKAALTVAGITLLQGLTKDPKGPSWAVLSTILLVVALLIATAYGSSLASTMTVPRFERPIDTAVELASSGMLWTATHEAWVFAILDAEEPEMRTLVENFRVLTPSEMTRRLDEGAAGNLAFAVDRLEAGNYGVEQYLSSESVEEMHLMSTDIYWGYCVAMLRKSSPYTKRLNQRILEIQASGIPVYWEADVTRQYMDSRTQFAVDAAAEDSFDGKPTRISVRNVQGTFFILGIGLLISSLVFFWEICSRLKSASKVYKTVHACR